MGKLSTEDLEKLLSYVKKHARVVVPPRPGFDSGVHLIDDNKYMVVSTDPCLGAPEKWFGWLLIHYAASDVALFGAKPEFCTINLLGPPRTPPETYYEIMKQVCEATDELAMAVVTGHTGTYSGLSTLVGVCTAYGMVNKEKLITPGGAKPGDYVFCVKPVGLETVVNFTLTKKSLAKKLFGAQQAQELEKLVKLQSCVREALLLAEVGSVHAMHDATEGGLTAALNEMAIASRVGFNIEFEKLPLSRETLILQKHFRLSNEQLLSISSTGTLLAAVSKEAENKVKAELRQHGIEVNVIGVFTEDTNRFLMKNGKKTVFPQKADDPYEKIIVE